MSNKIAVTHYTTKHPGKHFTVVLTFSAEQQMAAALWQTDRPFEVYPHIDTLIPLINTRVVASNWQYKH